MRRHSGSGQHGRSHAASGTASPGRPAPAAHNAAHSLAMRSRVLRPTRWRCWASRSAVALAHLPRQLGALLAGHRAPVALRATSRTDALPVAAENAAAQVANNLHQPASSPRRSRVAKRWKAAGLDHLGRMAQCGQDRRVEGLHGVTHGDPQGIRNQATGTSQHLALQECHRTRPSGRAMPVPHAADPVSLLVLFALDQFGRLPPIASGLENLCVPGQLSLRFVPTLTRCRLGIGRTLPCVARMLIICISTSRLGGGRQGARVQLTARCWMPASPTALAVSVTGFREVRFATSTA